MRPEYLEKFEFTSKECISDLSNTYENMRGESCPFPNPSVQIKFKQPNMAYISRIEIQRDHPKYPGNTRQIEATLIDSNNSLTLNAFDNNVLTLTSSPTEPIIYGYSRPVHGLNLRILKTDSQSLQGFRVKILGCYAQRKDSFF